MRNFRPNALRLTDKYQNTDISLNLTADFSGHSIDDMQGGIQLDSLSVRNPMENLSYFMPNLTITAGNKGIEKEIKINSPFLQGTIQGIILIKPFPPASSKQCSVTSRHF